MGDVLNALVDKEVEDILSGNIYGDSNCNVVYDVDIEKIMFPSGNIDERLLREMISFLHQNLNGLGDKADLYSTIIEECDGKCTAENYEIVNDVKQALVDEGFGDLDEYSWINDETVLYY